MSSNMGSAHNGRTGRMRSSGGNVASTAATAKVCSTSRGAGAIGRLSAMTPTAAIRSTAAKMTTSGQALPLTFPRKNKTPPEMKSVAPITAMPPPCGVGILWDERAFGFASA